MGPLVFGFIRRRKYAKISAKARKMAMERQRGPTELRPRPVDPFAHSDKVQGFTPRSGGERRHALDRRLHDRPVVQERRLGHDRRSGFDRRGLPAFENKIDLSRERPLSRSRCLDEAGMRRLDEAQNASDPTKPKKR